MLVSTDASALEWRVVTEISGDPTALKEIIDNIDIHTVNQHTFGLPSRLISKIYLFRTVFNRGKGYSFAHDPEFSGVSTSVKFWDDIGRKFYEKYNAIDKLYDKNLKLIANNAPIVGPLGREWSIKPFINDYGEMVLPVTKAVNYPVQGTGADVMMLARISFRNRLEKQSWAKHVKLISTVHDSISVDTEEQYTQKIVNLFHQVFDDLPSNIEKIFQYKWKTPLACECKVGKDMKDLKKQIRTDI